MAIVEIRDAAMRERDALRDLHRRSSFIWPEDHANLCAHPEVFGVAAQAIEQGRIRVAVAPNGSLLGFSGVSYDRDGVCELDDLFVTPDRLRTGIGSALVADAAARAVAAGCAELAVIAHRRTLDFYERAGFIADGPAQTRFGPALRLRRRLDGGPERVPGRPIAGGDLWPAG